MAATLQNWQRRLEISRLMLAVVAIVYAIGAFIRLDYVNLSLGANMGVRAGSLHVGWQDGVIPAESAGFSVNRAMGQVRWLPRFMRGSGTVPPNVRWWTLELPLWPVVALAVFGAAWSWRRVLMIRRNGCRRCGYPRLGIPLDAPCPECGLEVGKR